MPLNVFNKTIHLIYNLNNLCLLSLSLTTKKLNICHLNVIHIHIIAICIYFAAICLLSVSDLFLCNYSHIFLCFSRYTVVCPVTISHWLGINFCLIPYISIIFIILHNVLLLTCSISYILFLLWIYGKLSLKKCRIVLHGMLQLLSDHSIL
jgi:hypothetical protein